MVINPLDIKKSVRVCYKHFYANKFNLGEMDKFFKTHKNKTDIQRNRKPEQSYFEGLPVTTRNKKRQGVSQLTPWF